MKTKTTNFNKRVFRNFTLLVNFIGFFPNIIGAGILLLFFAYLRPGFNSIFDTQISKNIEMAIITSAAVFLTIIIKSKIRYRKISGAIKELSNGTISNDELTSLKMKILNIPVYTIRNTFIGWFSCGVLIPLFAFINNKRLKDAVLLFVIIFLICGAFSILITFFLGDSSLRRKIKMLFPDSDFRAVKDVKKINIYVKMISSFLIAGIIPVFLLYTLSERYIKVIQTSAYNTSLNSVYNIVVIVLLTLSVFVSILCSIYFSRYFGKTLVKLEENMKHVETGNYDVKIEVTQKDEIGNVCSGFNDMVSGLKERERIKDVFGKFVSSKIRDEILNNKIELGGTKHQATVLFCDIRNFTEISEKLNAKDVVDMLNSYFNEMVKAILKNNGVLDKFIGDAIMAVFGPPEGYDEHAQNALNAAITMVKKLKAFNEMRRLSGQHEINFGIGINTGEVIAGNIGSNERMEYTVIGDTVNVASRLEGLTKTYNVKLVISKSTFEQIENKEKYAFRSLDTIKVKGRKAPTEVYEVLIND